MIGAIDALLFDVQGTLLDFFTPVRAALAAALAERHLDADPSALTNEWRRSYFTGMAGVTEDHRPFVPTRTIYREGLDAILADAGLARHFTDADRDSLTDSWTRLLPWPDTADGLRLLRPRFTLATLTNGSMAATVALAARHDLVFHAILATELVRSFKPAPKTYRLALDSLGFPPERVVMVASHPYDLDAARLRGMQTAFLERPLEFGPDTPNTATAPKGTDLTAPDLVTLARQLLT